MNDLDIGWTAGIIDGEGCISIDKGRLLGSGQVRLTVGNTDTKLLSKLLNLWGGTTREVYPDRATKPNYQWRLNSSEAINVLRTTLPALTAKREQARLAIEFQETVTKSTRRLDNDVILKREELRDRIHKLNKGDR